MHTFTSVQSGVLFLNNDEQTSMQEAVGGSAVLSGAPKTMHAVVVGGIAYRILQRIRC
jgi:hypothetical protein